MPNYAPRVTCMWSDCSGIIKEWSDSCQSMVVYEHDADEEISSPHLHMVMLECKFKTPEALKRIFLKSKNVSKTGNALWSWEHKDYPNPDLKFITYMSKGTLRPVFVKNILPAVIEEHRLQWKDPTPKGTLLTERKESTKTKRELCDMISAHYKKVQEQEQHVCIEAIAKSIVSITINVLREHKIVFCKRKIQEYRDTVMGDFHPTTFTNFVNEDIFRFIKYNG